jgi:hypothetical protein
MVGTVKTELQAHLTLRGAVDQTHHDRSQKAVTPAEQQGSQGGTGACKPLKTLCTSI